MRTALIKRLFQIKLFKFDYQINVNKWKSNKTGKVTLGHGFVVSLQYKILPYAQEEY